jgi:hypothetical protein
MSIASPAANSGAADGAQPSPGPARESIFPALAQPLGLRMRIMLNGSERREVTGAAYSRSDHLID